MTKKVGHIGHGSQYMAALHVLGKVPMCLDVEASGKVAKIRIEGEISQWSGNSAQEFRQKIQDAISSGATDVHLYINSIGGSVIIANEIVNEIKKFSGVVTGEGGAIVASAATYIAIHCSHFTLAENGTFLIHKPYGAVMGNEDEIEATLKMIRNLTTQYVKAYAKKTGMKEQEIRDLIKNDFAMDAQEALDKGFIDGIADEAEITEETNAMLIAASMSPKQVKQNPQINPQSKQQKMKELLMFMAALLGLSPDATQDDVKASIQALQQKANELATVKAELQALKTGTQTAQVKTLLDDAINAKKITAEQRPTFEALASKDFDSTKTLIDGMKSVGIPSLEQTPQGDASAVQGKKWDDFSAQALRELHEKNYDAFNALHKEKFGTDAPKFKAAFNR